jgi:hypothetical protein
MELNWVVNYEENRLTFEIDNLRYTTVDGGQNIYKYVDGVETTRIRQFPNMPDDYVAPMQSPPVEAPEDEWSSEMNWLTDNYPEELGENLCTSEIRDFQQRDGSFLTLDFMPGMGPNNREDRIMVNRMGIPASVQERWDWNIIASSEEPQENSMFGTVWLKHITTGEIIRAGASQCVPCHVFPTILKPVTINEDDFEQDVQDFGGHIIYPL